jgi:hypothetical protein
MLTTNGKDMLTTNGKDMLTTNGKDMLTTNGRDMLTTNGKDMLTTNGRDMLTTNGGINQGILKFDHSDSIHSDFIHYCAGGSFCAACSNVDAPGFDVSKSDAPRS